MSIKISNLQQQNILLEVSDADSTKVVGGAGLVNVLNFVVSPTPNTPGAALSNVLASGTTGAAGAGQASSSFMSSSTMPPAMTPATTPVTVPPVMTPAVPPAMGRTSMFSGLSTASGAGLAF
jgi:hypothetical protein